MNNPVRNSSVHAAAIRQWWKRKWVGRRGVLVCFRQDAITPNLRPDVASFYW
jgi:hypothetical protein